MSTSPQAGAPRAPRCYTRALKNARFLQEHAPHVFAQDPGAEGFGTGIPVEVLRVLHRLSPESPVLNRHPDTVDFLRAQPLTRPGTAPANRSSVAPFTSRSSPSTRRRARTSWTRRT
jgi:hypothetical protein